jgi:hypothetical protein
MNTQLTLIPKVFTDPRSTFVSLPSDRWFILAWAAPLYFGVVRAFRPPNYETTAATFGGPIGVLALALVLGAIIIPLSFWILKQILKLFRKRLTVKKLMNIYGYSLLPRLVVAAIGYLVLFVSPSSFAGHVPKIVEEPGGMISQAALDFLSRISF